MTDVVTVQRPAFIQYENGDIVIMPVTLQIDPAKDDPRYSGVPLWPAGINYLNKNFVFKKDIVSPRNINLRRPLYVEKVPEPEKQLTLQEQVNALENIAKTQHNQVIHLTGQNREQLEIIQGLQEIIRDSETENKE